MSADFGSIAAMPEAPAGMDGAEWEARLELAATYRLVELYGWTSIVYNHITLRVPGTDEFLINPFGLRYDEITASNLVRVTLDGEKVSDSPWPINQAGYMIHSTLHRARPDLHCIIHTHEPISQSLCAVDAPCVPLTQEGCQFYERVGYHDFEGIVLDGSEGPRIVQAMGREFHTLVLRHHGLITGGSTCTWAFVRHLAFIRNTEVQLAAMATGRMVPIPVDVMINCRQQFEGGSAQAGAAQRHPEWPALIRRLNALDPSWKT
ncbi:class II aldolase/adducin family protein [Alphaproteobacteria bacterium]|jgi:ribulose-5-phosphate 4-epimerase/fuculose-1-phosphate aldolase|nr:class II aldolase/adducin family protein [Alphaproteobacteria bacterium]MDA8602903.1 class II aldolase/adducin family protein [Alphaproteobacteria bacterium]MDG1415084.1 class II aldolase/adducin family protein [Alphaproteobacteria bacterium]